MFLIQGGSTTTLVIRHAKSTDAGTYTLEAVNRYLTITSYFFVLISCLPLPNFDDKIIATIHQKGGQFEKIFEKIIEIEKTK